MKVQVIRKMGIASGVVLVGGTAAACGGTSPDAIASTSTANLDSDAVSPGSGTFSLTAYDLTYAANNGGDEYVRTGESLTFTLQFSDVWELLYPQDYSCENCPTNLSTVTVNVNLWYKKNGQNVSSVSLPVTWSKGTYVNTGSTAAVVLPAGVDQFYISYDAVDTTNGTKATRQYDPSYDTAVYGGDSPDKNLIFDTANGTFRERSIEGGSLVDGANVSLIYTDWRAATLVNSTSLDTNIGTQTNYSRFGTSVVALTAPITYQVTAEYTLDSGQTWTTIVLNEVDGGDQVLPKQHYGTPRIGYENKIQIPESSPGISVVFHVRAVINVNYDNYSDVDSRRYNQGDTIVLADVWDNNNTQNYSFGASAQ